MCGVCADGAANDGVPKGRAFCAAKYGQRLAATERH